MYLFLVVHSLSEEGRSWLHQYGSAMIDKLKFRDNLVLVGQKGLTRGSAIEKVKYMCTLKPLYRSTSRRRFVWSCNETHSEIVNFA